jgi:glycerol-3-phosphate dehydrogenase
MHAGFDPEPGSLMAKLNVEGAERAKELCKKLSVHYDQIGSLVVAFSDEELSLVELLYERGPACSAPSC